MSATSVIEDDEKESVVDDMSTPIEDIAVNIDKLAALKAKSAAKQQEGKMASKIIAKKERSLNFGIIGSGQAGGNIAAYWHSLGYTAVALNTAAQDFKLLNLPDSNKLLLENGPIGGASKELLIGQAAAEANRLAITELVHEKLSDSQINILALSLGGGSGAGSCETLVDILSETGKPLIVMSILPMDSEDSQTKANALETLAKLAAFAKTKKIANLMVVDNAKIESIFSNVSQMDFYSVANKSIVDPLDTLNTLSSMASTSKSFDPMEYTKLLVDGEGLTVYGELTIENYTEDTAIAEAVIQNLDSNLLSSGFDLKQSKYVSFVVVANKTVWSKIPAASINYSLAMINDICGSPKGVFRGIYEVDMPENVVKVYSMFSGLGLPTSRVDQLKKDTKELQSKVKEKDDQRNLTLQLDTGTNETVSAAQKIKAQIAAKNSTFGKFIGGTVDRRNK